MYLTPRDMPKGDKLYIFLDLIKSPNWDRKTLNVLELTDGNPTPLWRVHKAELKAQV